VLLCGCAKIQSLISDPEASGHADDDLRQLPYIAGRVMSISEGGEALVAAESLLRLPAGLDVVGIDGRSSAVAQLEAGMVVRVYYEGDSPAEGAKTIEICSAPEDIAGVYMEAIRTLVLSEGFSMQKIALDLSEVYNLADTEKAGLAQILYEETMLDCEMTTKEELKRAGALSKKGDAFPSGLLIVISCDSGVGGDFEFTLSAWQSDKKAVEEVSCKAVYSPQSGYSYKVESDGDIA